MAEVEGLGDVATGAVLAKAVEPRTGPGGRTHQETCLNCGCELAGAYCHCCGQRGQIHRTIAAWWHDFVHAVLHVDGKFWSTLGMLAWQPGDLTRRYAHGERAKFVSPLALFLFTVFLMFAVFSALGASVVGGDLSDAQAAQIEAELDQSAATLERVRRERQAAGPAGTATAPLDARIAELETEIAAMRAGTAAAGRPLIDTDVETGWPLLDKAIAKANSNPALLFYKLQANAYKFSWALIPISVPFVWVLFLHRRRYREQFTGYDHLVFVTYSIGFMSLVLVATVLLNGMGIDNSLVDLAFVVVPPVHIYRQLRGAYGLDRFSAAWRTLALLLFASVALGLFLLLLLAIGVFG